MIDAKPRPGMGTPRRAAFTERFAQFDMRRLLYLREAVAAGSVRGAGARLGMSPSAVSRQIAKVEEDLQVAVLDRHGRGVRPTDAGLLLVEYFEKQATGLDSLANRITDMLTLREGAVSIALGEGFLAVVMSEPLREFCQQYPGLQFDLQFGGTEEIVRRILDDDAHLGLAYNPPTEPALHSIASKRHPLCAVVAPTHPLAAAAPGRLQLHDLMGHEIGLPPPGTGVRQAVLKAEMAGHLTLSPRLTSSSVRALLHFAEEWGGVVLTPAFSVRREVEQGRLLALPLEEGALGCVEAHLVIRRGRRLPASAERLVREARTRFEIFR
ncbi:LysR family transcriptional regulator [Methylobacterium aquaticum]|uniref:LysR family transcriptional regulator n=1 Tax=Methylobacterium aquaticum TaxID=270351 RepID=UPI003D179734